MRIAWLLAAAWIAASDSAAAFEFCASSAARNAFNEDLAQWPKALEKKRFADLERHYADLLSQHRFGRLDDARLHRAFEIFEEEDPGLEPRLLGWVAAHPKSQAAYLALGHHYLARALALGAGKGDVPAAETSDAQLRELRPALRAFELADRFGSKPTLSNAARLRIALVAGPLLGLDAKSIYRKTIRAHPDALEVRVRMLFADAGSPERTLAAIEAVHADARDMAEPDRRYIRYLALQRAASVLEPLDPRGAAARYEEGIPLCPGLNLSLKRAVALYERLGDAAALARTATVLIGREPYNGWAHAMRGKARKQVGDLAGAFAAYSRSAELACPCAFEPLAWFYENGQSVPKDTRRAAELYATAAYHGVEGAREKADRLRKRW